MREKRLRRHCKSAISISVQNNAGDTVTGPFLTRNQIWEEINRILGGNRVSRRYFDMICADGKGPTVALRYGRKCLYPPNAAAEWIANYMRPDKSAA
jgi:hypothetical protein